LGVASSPIARPREIAAERGDPAIYVQTAPGDDAAVSLDEKPGRRKQALHFDVLIEPVF
jgi:hypothetical protein